MNSKKLRSKVREFSTDLQVLQNQLAKLDFHATRDLLDEVKRVLEWESSDTIDDLETMEMKNVSQ